MAANKGTTNANFSFSSDVSAQDAEQLVETTKQIISTPLVGKRARLPGSFFCESGIVAGEAASSSGDIDGVAEINVSPEPSCRPKPDIEFSDNSDFEENVPRNVAAAEGLKRLVLSRYRLIAPKRTQDDQHDVHEDDKDGEEGTRYWQQVLQLRNVMLEKRKGPGYQFTRSDIVKFNELGRKRIKDLVGF